jgi:uncharacterized linocin/CFP29 family protein
MENIKPEQIDWTKDPFKSVNDAVVVEANRTAVGTKFLPVYGPVPSNQTTVPRDSITITQKIMSVDQTATTPIIELMVPFKLTQEQYDQEHLNTAVTLATRAANLLAQAKDLVFFQGNGDATTKFFSDNPVVIGNGSVLPSDLVALLNPTPPHIIKVPPKANTNGSQSIKYGEHTSSAVGHAYSLLQSKGHYGPYALVLHSDIYADIVESLDNTLIMPKDRITFFVTETGLAPGKDESRCYGTGTLRPFTGLFMSLGGDTMDAVVANSPSTRFSTRQDGALRFEVFERFTLRLKDPTAVVLLEFAQA